MVLYTKMFLKVAIMISLYNNNYKYTYVKTIT